MKDVRINFNNSGDIQAWAARLNVSPRDLFRMYLQTGSNLLSELKKAFAGRLTIYSTRDNKDLL